MHDRTSEFLQCWERLVADIETSLRKDQFLFLCLSVSRCIWVLSHEVVDALDLHALSVKDDTTSTNRFNVEVKLGKCRLLFHQHHGSLTLVHHLELFLLLSHLLLVLELDLVIPLELFFCVTSLQVQFNFQIASMSFNYLLLLVALSLRLCLFEVCQVFPPFLGL